MICSTHSINSFPLVTDRITSYTLLSSLIRTV
ncbi:CRISPR-associated DxTHG motif protein [Blautia sp. OM07-19]|nr:CRISPR-associated DxTHG motif protein [Blautia sp. OM07-19]